jgi:hypothetical protein
VFAQVRVAWKDRIRMTSRTIVNFGERVDSPLHGGGQGFDSPRLHSDNLLFCSTVGRFLGHPEVTTFTGIAGRSKPRHAEAPSGIIDFST